MASETKSGWDLLPTWETAGPSWSQLFQAADNQIQFTLMLASVTASGWAVGKSQQEIESEARRRLVEGK